MDDLDRARVEIAELEVEVAALERVLAPPARRRVLPVLVSVGMAAAAVFGVSFAIAMGGATTEVMYGEISASTGGVTSGLTDLRCALYAWTSDGEDYDLQFEVLCGGWLAYGGDGLGHVDCRDHHGGWWWRCDDPDSSHQGGDPQLHFDRARRFVRISDPGWTVEIALTTPPAGTGGPE